MTPKVKTLIVRLTDGTYDQITEPRAHAFKGGALTVELPSDQGVLTYAPGQVVSVREVMTEAKKEG